MQVEMRPVLPPSDIMDISIRPVREIDSAEIASIYNTYVLETCVTFETDPVDAVQMAARIAEVAASELPWLVAEQWGRIVGYAYASRWKSRWGYRYSVESTIYLDSAHKGKGFGIRLYSALVDALRLTPTHAVIGGVALPNDASVRIHERLGFRKVAHFAQVGYKQERWVDVGYWQLLLV